MAKLWDKGYSIDTFVEHFTVGEDYILDAQLIEHDCIGNAAQARTLQKAGLLTGSEADSIIDALVKLMKQTQEGDFTVNREDEDVHTAVEGALTRLLGETGKKIHAGRSRNDQVIVDLRLYARQMLLETISECEQLTDALDSLISKHAMVPMMGRTHTQRAMPSSVGLWAGAYLESMEEDIELARGLYSFINRCPLGSGASYGSALNLDRDFTSTLLGFDRPTTNVLHANHGRGRLESACLGWACQVSLSLSRMAADLILFSLPEFGYFTLPKELCSGSSLMPNKRNPCALELVRARAATVFGYHNTILNIVRALPAGYNRDLQETKAPFMRGMSLVKDMIHAIAQAVSRIEVHPDVMRKAFTPEVFATDRALELVLEGQPFRDAYRHVGTHLEELKNRDPDKVIANRKMSGTTGNLSVDRITERLESHLAFFHDESRRIDKVISGLFGND